MSLPAQTTKISALLLVNIVNCVREFLPKKCTSKVGLPITTRVIKGVPRCILHIRVHSSEPTARWLENGGPGLSRCMDPIENGNFPASYVIVYQAGYMERQRFHDSKSNRRIHQTWRMTLVRNLAGKRRCFFTRRISQPLKAYYTVVKVDRATPKRWLSKGI